MKGHHFRRNRTLGGQPRTCTVKCTLVAALLLFVAGVSTGCNKGSDTPAATVEKPKQAQSIPAVPQVVFGIEQNDSGGHKGVPWGTDQGSMKLKSDDGFCSEDGSKLVAKLVGPPLLSGEDVEMSNELNKMGVANVPPSIPPKMPDSLSFSSDDSGSCLGFVDEKFALAITYIGTAQQDQGRALTQISQKYQKAGTVQENDWGGTPLPQIDFVPPIKGTLFRKGGTNTRIYYLQRGDRDDPNPMLYAAVIPNSYFVAIEEQWQKQILDNRAEVAKQVQQLKLKNQQEEAKRVQQAIQ